MPPFQLPDVLGILFPSAIPTPIPTTQIVPSGSAFDATLKFQGQVPEQANQTIVEQLAGLGYQATSTSAGNTASIQLTTKQPKTVGSVADDLVKLIRLLMALFGAALGGLVALSFLQHGGFGALGSLANDAGAIAADLAGAAAAIAAQVRQALGVGGTVGNEIVVIGMAAVIGLVVWAANTKSRRRR